MFDYEECGQLDDNNKRVGIWITYEINEKTKEKTIYLETYYENGNLIKTVEYDFNYNKLFETEYKDNLMHGKRKEFNSDMTYDTTWYYKGNELHRCKKTQCDIDICKQCMGKEFEKGFLGATICKLKTEQHFDRLNIIKKEQFEEEIIDVCPYYLEQIEQSL